MSRTIRFLANDRLIETESYGLVPSLDFIRKDLGLTGAKEGCREGDCGACSVLIGVRAADASSFSYRAHCSCVTSLAELDGRHLVTVEGLSAAGLPGSAGESVRLTPVMRAILEENGSQCGFCSPGFVIALTGLLLEGPPYTEERVLASIEGNLCRCTGYGAQKRAALRLARDFADLPADPFERLRLLVDAHVVPQSMLDFARGKALPVLKYSRDGDPPADPSAFNPTIGGGTDFLVRHPHPEREEFGEDYALLTREDALLRISLVEAEVGSPRLEIGAAVTWRDFFADPLVRRTIPSIASFEDLLASPLVRGQATIGGNIANASPVADITSMLIALGASVRLRGRGEGREVPLERLFLGYKKLDLREDTRREDTRREIIEAVLIPAAKPIEFFNFEKASKRGTLDIAAVNTAAVFETDRTEGGAIRITRARISAGGVAPVPLLLERTSSCLAGSSPGAQAAAEAADIAAAETTPIGDVRGSADYRRRVLRRLVIAHFVRLFPGSGAEEALL